MNPDNVHDLSIIRRKVHYSMDSASSKVPQKAEIPFVISTAIWSQFTALITKGNAALT